MDTAKDFEEKRTFLLGKIKSQLNQRSIKYNCHDAQTSELEGVLARGDRKLCKVILDAYKKGCIYDAWTEFFKPELWEEALCENQIDISFYTTRERDSDEIFPWDFIDVGVTKKFLRSEYENALNEKVTPNCRVQCSGCGAGSFGVGVCVQKGEEK